MQLNFFLKPGLRHMVTFSGLEALCIFYTVSGFNMRAMCALVILVHPWFKRKKKLQYMWFWNRTICTMNTCTFNFLHWKLSVEVFPHCGNLAFTSEYFFHVIHNDSAFLSALLQSQNPVGPKLDPLERWVSPSTCIDCNNLLFARL